MRGTYLAHADCPLMLSLADLLGQVVQVQELREGTGDLHSMSRT